MEPEASSLNAVPFRCYCGKIFSQQSGLTNHSRSCKPSLKRFSSALTSAKDAWAARKRRKKETAAEEANPKLVAATADRDGVVMENHKGDDVGPEPPFLNNSGPSAESAQNIEPSTIDDSGPGTLPLAVRRPRRKILLPKRFRDNQPEAPPSLPPPVRSEGSLPDEVDPGSSINPFARVRRVLKSSRNIFGLFRQFFASDFPSHDPEGEVVAQHDLSDIVVEPIQPAILPKTPSISEPWSPYPNHSSFVLGEWFWNSSPHKSKSDFRNLVGIITDPAFRTDDIRGTRWDQIDKKLGSSTMESELDWLDEPDAGWKRTPIKIRVPFSYKSCKKGFSEPLEPQDFVMEEFYHRSIISVLKERISSPDACHFHFEPYELYWQPSAFPQPIRTQGELYTSPAFIEAHNTLQASPPEPGCDLPRVVAALMFASDATQLTSFGQAKIWPLYMGFGNDSKYRRAKPSLHLCNHIAYFQNLPDNFKDFIIAHAGPKGARSSLIVHCHRELIHAQWKVIMDDEFMDAYTHGVVLTCPDGLLRRFYLRVFTYSADYPEKILLASIRNLGNCPCPRCEIPLSKVHNIGMPLDRIQRRTKARIDDASRRAKVDTARSLIYENGHLVNSSQVEKILKPQSLVPTSNAFSERLSPLGFNMFPIFVVDILHEFEIGVWRSLFIHLLRILQCTEGLLHELDKRYRLVPNFGRDTIRKFRNNTSEMKQLAARDFEDLLQCAIPVFDGLLPEPHNSRLLDLLFIFAHWHALAKLRLHTDLSLELLDENTTLLGEHLRDFHSKIIPAFDTKELPREKDARERRRMKTKKQSAAKGSASLKKGKEKESSQNELIEHIKISESEVQQSFPRPRAMNLNTYKVHSLGDYVNTIRQYGTTDSFSTEMGELEHRTSKSIYSRTSRKGFLKQMTQIERRQARIRRIREKLNNKGFTPTLDRTYSNHDRYHLGSTQNRPEHIISFVQQNAGDPAVKNFIPKLKEHLLPRVLSRLNIQNPPLKTSDSMRSIFFKSDRMYAHRIIRFNYTTYDVRRSQDVINPRTPHSSIMMLCDENWEPEGHKSHNHPFLYAKVIGIYHVNVVYTGHGMVDYNPMRFDFLQVQWYDHIINTRKYRLDQVTLSNTTEGDAFGFVDPADVLRGCHVIPAFSHGEHSRVYYIGRFVDRDMMMRYHWGNGIGHTYAHGRHATRMNNPTTNESSTLGHIEESSQDQRGSGGAEAAVQDNLESDSEDVETDLELTLEERENENLCMDANQSDGGSDLGPDDSESDDEIFEMYHL